jgi:ribose transport system substrate-binding protein
MRKTLTIAIALTAFTAVIPRFAGAAGSGKGAPVVVQPSQARDFVHNALKGKKIAFVPIAYKGFELTGQWGIQLQRTFDNLGATFTVSDPNFDTNKMVQMIDAKINEGVDMLILHNPDVGVLTAQIKKAQSKGIYVVVVNMISSQSADAFIGADVQSAAADLAGRMVKDCKAKNLTKVAIIDGWGPDGFSIGANAGWEPVFKAAGLKVVSKQQGKYDPAGANQIAATVLQQNKDLCGFAVNWDIMATGAAQAVSAAGLKGKVGVYNLDASATWCKSLRDGSVTAGAAYHVPGIGVGAAIAAQQLFELKNKPGTERTIAYVPHSIVDKSNVDGTSGACYALG